MQRDTQLLDLNRACGRGDLDRVTELFEINRQWSHDDLHGFLFSAARGGHVAVCRLLLEKGAKIDSAPFSAPRTKSVALLELFVEYGWNVNDSWLGYVLLPEVVGDEKLVRWLLDQGADPNIGVTFVDPHAQADTPPPLDSGAALNAAASQGTIAVIDLLIERGAKLENSAALHFAAGYSSDDAERIPVIQHLLELGFNINGTDDILGSPGVGTPLHWAVRGTKLEIAKFLVENGADCQKINRFGYLPLQLARSARYKEFKELLQR